MAIKLLWSGLFLTVALGSLSGIDFSLIGKIVMGVGVVLLWLDK